jgi:hypothetical protein
VTGDLRVRSDDAALVVSTAVAIAALVMTVVAGAVW